MPLMVSVLMLSILAPCAAMAAANIKDAFAYDNKGKKDPFLPGELVWNEKRTAAYLRECKLEGIVWDDVNPVIIVEGNVIKKGESYIGATLESIEKDKAVFVVGQEKIIVPVASAKTSEDKNAK